MPTPDPGSYVLISDYDRPPLTANDRMHWRPKAELTARLRYWAEFAARQAQIPRLPRCRVELIWQVVDHRRRDVDNIVPTLKPICDGLVDAGIVPDDVPELMEKPMPQIVHASRADGAVPSLIVVITPLEAAP